jgi:uncharacterized protein YecE (DUF72 family)
LNEFRDAVKGLGAKLGPVLYQLPETFKADTVLLREFLQSLPKGMRSAFEFRHESWFTDEIFSLLTESNAALCIAEADDDLDVPFEPTADWGYLRLRKAKYSPAAIKAWVKRVREQKWRDTFVFFKHEETGTGPKFARKFLELAAS